MFSEVNSYSIVKIRICLDTASAGYRLVVAVEAMYELRYIRQGTDDEVWLLLQ
jgi:hypothetical protein